MFTAYAAAKYINKKLGGAKKLPPQMFYTYYKKGYITTSVNEDGVTVATEKALDEWFQKYNTKRLENEARKEAEVKEQLAGK